MDPCPASQKPEIDHPEKCIGWQPGASRLGRCRNAGSWRRAAAGARGRHTLTSCQAVNNPDLGIFLYDPLNCEWAVLHTLATAGMVGQTAHLSKGWASRGAQLQVDLPAAAGHQLAVKHAEFLKLDVIRKPSEDRTCRRKIDFDTGAACGDPWCAGSASRPRRRATPPMATRRPGGPASCAAHGRASCRASCRAVLRPRGRGRPRRPLAFPRPRISDEAHKAGASNPITWQHDMY